MNRFLTACTFAAIGLPGSAVGYDVKPAPSNRPAKAARFECSPRRLKAGDTLTLRISTPHGRDLAVVDPDGRFLFVVYFPDSSSPPPLVDWEAFQNMPEIRLNTSTAKAPTLNEGWETPVRIFTKAGKYRVLLSENLETEPSAKTVNECTIIFRGQQP